MNRLFTSNNAIYSAGGNLLVPKKNRSLNKQYKQGFSNHLGFLKVRKEEFEVALSTESIKSETLRSAVDLYVSVGGGFMAETKNKNTSASKK